MGGEKLILLVATPGREGSPPRGRGKGCPEGHGPPSKGITPAWAGKSHAVHSPSHGAGDHPRVGGEKWMTPKGEISYIGSPPRGRGKGKSLAIDHAQCWDHPRVGGEKNSTVHSAWRAVGSPPRGRGKGMAATVALKARRITPAWAGKSRLRGPSGRRSKDHPRVGGEKSALQRG